MIKPFSLRCGKCSKVILLTIVYHTGKYYCDDCAKER